MQIVNGYVCFNCSDVAAAKKHTDPAHPDQDPAAQKSAKPLETQTQEAVTFGGTLSAPTGTGKDPRADTKAARRVDLTA